MAFWFSGNWYEWRIKGTDIDPLKIGLPIEGKKGNLTVNYQGKKMNVIAINVDNGEELNLKKTKNDSLGN